MINFFKKAKYWNNLEIPAKLFFERMAEDDNNLLIIQGKPKSKHLDQAWDDIFDMFFKEKKSLELGLILKTQTAIALLHYRIEMYDMFIQVMYITLFNPEIIKKWIGELKKVKLRVDEKKPIREEIIRIQKYTIPQLVTDLELEIENLKKLTQGEKAKFYEMLAAISTNFHIPESISLAMFLGYEKRLTKK